MTLHNNYFGSCHGKGPSDGEGGVVKSFVTRQVQHGAVVKDAEQFYEIASKITKGSHSEEKCSHSRRTFFYVHSNYINIDRADRDVKTVSGTQKIHSVRGEKPGHIRSRRFSCFCPRCRGNSDVASMLPVEWTSIMLKRKDGSNWPNIVTEVVQVPSDMPPP